MPTFSGRPIACASVVWEVGTWHEDQRAQQIYVTEEEPRWFCCRRNARLFCGLPGGRLRFSRFPTSIQREPLRFVGSPGVGAKVLVQSGVPSHLASVVVAHRLLTLRKTGHRVPRLFARSPGLVGFLSNLCGGASAV